LRTWRAKLLVKFDKFALKASLTSAYGLNFSNLTQDAEIMAFMVAQQGFQSDFLTNSAR
jgi:hypothetical protein